MLVAALRRFAFVAVLAVAVTALVSLLLGLLVGSGAARALTLGFYLMGSFLMIAGFFIGNRGPARVKSESAGPMVLPIPGFGDRRLRWATLREQEETINNSAIFVVLGVVLIAIGVLFDSHHSLF